MCKENKDIECFGKAHLFGREFSDPLSNEISNIDSLTHSSRDKKPLRRKGPWEKGIICKICDGKMNIYENPCYDLFLQDDRLPKPKFKKLEDCDLKELPPELGIIKINKDTQINLIKYALFVLWKADRFPLYAKLGVKLKEEHLKNIEDMLLKNIGDPSEYDVMIYWVDNVPNYIEDFRSLTIATAKAIKPSYTETTDGNVVEIPMHDVYEIHLGRWIIHIKIGSQGCLKKHAGFSLGSGEKLIIHKRDYKNPTVFEHINKLVKKIAALRKKSTRA